MGKGCLQTDGELKFERGLKGKKPEKEEVV